MQKLRRQPDKLVVAFCFLLLPLQIIFAQDITTLKNQKALKISGNLSIGINTYNLISGTSIGYLNPLSWSVNGNLIASVYGISVPVSVLISNQNKAYTLPFSRFGLSPHYKWATLYLGWQSLNFSQFTLGGQNIFGAGISLNPRKFHFDFMYGKFNKAITDISMFNNLNNSNTPVYSRKGFATQVGYGDEKNNVFLSYLRAKDDSNSISQDIKSKSQIFAAANQVIGIRSKISFLKHANWYIDAAVSHYIRDLSTDTIGGSNTFKYLFSPAKNASQLLTALETGFQWNVETFGLGIKYRRIDPDYKSMGAFYLQTDIEQYTINPSCRLLKNTLFLTGSLGIQHDNLYNKNAHSSNRTISLLNVSYNPNQTYGIDAQYSNFGISQQLLTQYINPNPNQSLYDSVRIDQVSQSITVSPHVIFINTKQINNITGSFSFQNLIDKNPISSIYNNFNSTIAVITHSINFLKSKWQASQTFTYINTNLSTGDISNLGYTLGASKNIEKKKLTLNGNASYYLNILSGHNLGNTERATVGAGFNIRKNQSLQAGAGIIATNNKAMGNLPENHIYQLTTYIRYNLSFQ